MAASPAAAAPPSPTQKGPPPLAVILFLYTVLGLAASFLAGREPGTLPDDVAREMAASIAIICTFLTSYSLLDVMAVGRAKQRSGMLRVPYNDLPSRIPEEVYNAQRAQANQVEQLPSFIVGTLCFSFFVNGRVGAVLALMWAVLRCLYASAYRRSVGVPFEKIGLAKFTVPAYFVVNTMLMGTAIHALRCIFL